jgi:hypothetical protein
MISENTIAYTIPDAVKATGLTRTRLYSLMGDNAIHAIKAGRRTLIRADSLRDYVNALPPAIIKPAKMA